jgi:hypothetical protein
MCTAHGGADTLSEVLKTELQRAATEHSISNPLFLARMTVFERITLCRHSEVGHHLNLEDLGISELTGLQAAGGYQNK